jgi:hypothetical protein
VAAAVSEPAGGAVGLHVAEYMPPEPTDAPEESRTEVLRGQRSLQVIPLPARNGLRCSTATFAMAGCSDHWGFSSAPLPGLSLAIVLRYQVNLSPDRNDQPDSGATAYLGGSEGVPTHEGPRPSWPATIGPTPRPRRVP